MKKYLLLVKFWTVSLGITQGAEPMELRNLSSLTGAHIGVAQRNSVTIGIMNLMKRGSRRPIEMVWVMMRAINQGGDGLKKMIGTKLIMALIGPTGLILEWRSSLPLKRKEFPL
jgi:hypothetical protein